MFAGCCLLCCVLFAASGVRCVSAVVYYSLFVVCCELFALRCVVFDDLFIFCMCVVSCVLFIVRCVLLVVLACRVMCVG